GAGSNLKALTTKDTKGNTNEVTLVPFVSFVVNAFDHRSSTELSIQSRYSSLPALIGISIASGSSYECSSLIRSRTIIEIEAVVFTIRSHSCALSRLFFQR